jgi:hypothetical protein
VLRRCCVACSSRKQEERAQECGGRTSATAASYSASLLYACAFWRGVILHRFGPIGVRLSHGCGRQRVPGAVRDGLVGAADEQRRSGFSFPVNRRIVQRCEPARRGGTAQPVTIRNRGKRPDGPGKAHPPWFLVFKSARASTSLWTMA